MINIAIIGAGFMGDTHAKAYSDIDGACPYCIVDIDENKGRALAEKYNAKYYSDIKDALTDSNVTVIDICLPTPFHEENAILAVNAKKHVLCEKPFTLSLDAAKRVADAAKKSGVIFMVAQVIRFWPEYVKINEIYKSGKLGTVKTAYACRMSQFPNWSDWFKDPKMSGGALFDLGLHDIDFLRYIFGPVKSVYSSGIQASNGAWNNILTTLNFKNGVKAIVECSNEMNDSFPFTMAFRANGDAATVDFYFNAGFNLEARDEAISRFMLFEKGGKPEELTADKTDAYEVELKYFIDCIKNNKQPEVITLDESVEVIDIICAMEKSLNIDEVVYL